MVEVCPAHGAHTLQVTHVIAGLGKADGGPSYSVPALATAMARLGARVRLRTIEDGACRATQEAEVARTMHAASGGLPGTLTRQSADLARAVAVDADGGSVLHAHGLWLMPNIYPARARRSAERARLVHSPRGMLASAARHLSAWKKQPFWWLAQRAALEAADCLHATAPSEYAEIRGAGLTNPVAVIANGVDLPNLAGFPYAKREACVVLSLGRIHPKKGLDRLVRAWAAVERTFPHWHLRIVGPAEERHDRELRVLAQALGLARVDIEGPAYDGEVRLAIYRDADVFVLPSLNENFAMTVAEALAAEVPVIATRGAPWAGLETQRCGWWIDHGVAPLADALREAMTIGMEARRAMGMRGRAWMARDFGWNRAAHDMLDVYRWLQTGGAPPCCVHLD